MFNYILITFLTIGISVQNYAKKEYMVRNRENKSAMSLFNLVMSSVSLLIFVLLTIGKFSFHMPTMIYAILNGLFFAVNIYTNMQAIKHGPLVLTALISSYSLIIPSIYGLIFLGELVTFFAYIGFLLLAMSLYLINRPSENNLNVSLKWIIYALINFLSNGICSTILKVHQTKFDGMYKLEYLTIVMIIATITCIFPMINFKPKELLKTIKTGWVFPLIAAILNVVNNIVVMGLAATMPAAILFPLMAGGSIVLTFFLSKFVFKESLSYPQKIGFVFGTIAVILLSI